MASYYKRIQTVISFGEEDLYHFVESQNMKNSLYIKKLIREEMVRQAGKGAVLPQMTQPAAPVIEQEAVAPKQEVKRQEQEQPVPEKKERPRIQLDEGGMMF